MPFLDSIPVWYAKTSFSTSRDSTGKSWKTTSENYYETLNAIQRSYQRLKPFWVVILVWWNKTSSSTSRDSIGTIRKTPSGHYCKTLSVIQRLDQKFWPFWAVIPVLRDKTSSLMSRDSIGTSRSTTTETTIKLWARSNGWIKSYDPFQLLFRSGATRPAL
jgi:hypothetical protein